MKPAPAIDAKANGRKGAMEKWKRACSLRFAAHSSGQGMNVQSG